MNNNQQNQDKKSKDPHGLLKLVAIIAGFIGLMILLKYLLDILQK